MEIGSFIALTNISAPEKIRLMVHTPREGVMGAHAPLPSLVRAAFIRERGIDWCQYADGTLIQWGQGQGIDPLVVFPREFDKVCWHVCLTSNESQGGNQLVVRAALNVTRLSFTAEGRFIDFTGGGGQATTGFSWLAFGV